MFASRRLLDRKITKVLVANRGEIACRVFRTANAMGIRTVAVYCDAEPNSKHVQHADEAFRIGPPPAVNSYLKGDEILKVAKQCGADAIHPGYGFLSENAEFADEVAKSGVEFIGPPSSAITSMGSKSESKNIMIKADVPVLPGYHGEDQSAATLKKVAEEIGFPVLIKAVSGGGGKGMKIVTKAADFDTMLQSAKREATNFFKDDRVLIEKLIERPRHIEVQVFCDKHGNGVYFFERDCSVQRRYQKVLEEAPAPHITPELRKHFGEIAVRAANAVGYVGAGTVEFIFDTDTDKAYFMEMNTRLQVEHPVTEEVVLVKGQPLDLVKLQLEVAEGKPLPFGQDDLELNGHAIEARVFAESPRDGFLPGCGHLSFVQEPPTGVIGDVKVRVDTGFRSGDDVLMHYDPMIAKLIVWGKTRDIALRGLRRALDEYHIVGINTNIDFCKECCDNEEFMKGGITTRFIEDHKESLLKAPQHSTANTAAAAVSWLRAAAGSATGAFRVNTTATVKVPFVDDNKVLKPVTVTFVDANTYTVAGEGWTHSVTTNAAPLKEGYTAMYVDGAARLELKAVVASNQVALLTPTGTHVFKLQPLPATFGHILHSHGSGDALLSPMPGKVTKFLVEPGAAVAAGDNVLIVEAMKMEHLVKAPCDGNVKFNCKVGDMTANDDVLASIE